MFGLIPSADCFGESTDVANHHSPFFKFSADIMELYEEQVSDDFRARTVVHIFPTAHGEGLQFRREVELLERTIIAGYAGVQVHLYTQPASKQWLHISARRHFVVSKLSKKIEPLINLSGVYFPHQVYEYARDEGSEDWWIGGLRQSPDWRIFSEIH